MLVDEKHLTHTLRFADEVILLIHNSAEVKVILLIHNSAEVKVILLIHNSAEVKEMIHRDRETERLN